MNYQRYLLIKPRSESDTALGNLEEIFLNEETLKFDFTMQMISDEPE